MNVVSRAWVLPVVISVLLWMPVYSAHAAPDLTCTVSAEVNGQEVTLTATVENVGDTTAENSFFASVPDVGAIYLHSETTPSGLPDASIEFENLEPGAESALTIQTGPHAMFPGNYTAWCVVNPSGFPVQDEENLENNEDSANYTIDVPPEAGPDLLITGIAGELHPQPEVACPEQDGICIRFILTAENAGVLAAPAFSADVFPGLEAEPDYFLITESGVFCDFPDGLEAGESETVTCAGAHAFPNPGAFTVYAYADWVLGGQIEEENESNNNFIQSVVVEGPPDLVVFSFEAAQADPEIAQIEFEVVVENTGGSEASDAQVCVFWQQLEPPEPADSPDGTKVVSVPAGEKVSLKFQQQGAIGGTWTAYAQLDCNGAIAELSEDNNASEISYDVQGEPNVDPILEGVDGPESCHEAELCVWTVTVTDETALPLEYRIINAPYGMWIDPEDGTVYYAPPLGSTSPSTSLVIEVEDKAGASVSTSLSFAVFPPAGFQGRVGQEFSMPVGSNGVACPLVEVPGSGFAYVDAVDFVKVSFFGSPTAQSSVTKEVLVLLDFAVADAELSCHVEALPDGGFALFEVTTRTVLVYGNSGALQRTIGLDSLAPGGIYSDMFIAVAPHTLAFLDVQAPPDNRLVFVDTAVGALATSWGGNLADEVGGGTPGILQLHDAGAMFPYENYLWSDGQIVRVYNLFHAARRLVDYDSQGQIQATHSIEELLPPPPELNEQPDWVLVAAKDGGLQIVDYTTFTLQWYDGTFTPVSNFTLPAANAPAGEWPQGWVSLGDYGLSVNNVHCEALGAGGFTCHDLSEGRGLVIDGFGAFWENCPILDVSPPLVHFGGVKQAFKKTIPLTVANKGGGVLQIDKASIQTSDPNSFGVFVKDGLPQGQTVLLFPGETVTVDLSYEPVQWGGNLAFLDFESNACQAFGVPIIGYSGPYAEVTPNPIEFVGVDSAVHQKTLTVTSAGSDPVTLLGLSLNNPIIPVFGSNPAVLSDIVLQPGETFEIDVSFDGTVPGTHFGSLVLQTTATGASETTVELFGSTEARVRATPEGFNFESVPVGGTVTRSVTVQNTGYTPIDFELPVLSGPPGFSLDTSDFQTKLGYNESFELQLSYTAAAPGTAVGLILLTPTDENIEPFVLTAVAGTGTQLPAGFTGELPIDAIGGNTIGLSGAMLELSTGGFAVYGTQTGAIHVVTGAGEPDTWFGIGGRIQVEGPGGAFPEATGLGHTLVELRSGGFALMSSDEALIYCIGPNGEPNRFMGADGVIDLSESFNQVQTVGDTLVQRWDTGSFLLADRDGDALLAVQPSGVPDVSLGTGGVMALTGADPVAGGGLATGVGDTLALTPNNGLVFGDTETQKFYNLASDASQTIESPSEVVSTFVGDLAYFHGSTLLFFESGAGVIHQLGLPTMEPVFDFGTDGQINVMELWPEATLGTAVIGLRDGLGVAVGDTSCDCLRFVAPDGTPLILEPALSAEFPSTIDFGVVGVGSVSEPVLIPISNTGKSVLVVQAVFSNGQFHLADHAVTVSVGPGDSADLPLVFAPLSVGSFTASLSVTTNEAGNPEPVVISLAGNTGAQLTVSPSLPVMDFGYVDVDVSDAALPVKSLLLGNGGALALTLTSVEISNTNPDAEAFLLDLKPSDGTTIEPGGASQAIGVKCNPPGVGEFYGTVTVNHDVPTQPPLTVSLVCRSGAGPRATPALVQCNGVLLGDQTVCGVVKLRNVGVESFDIVDTIAVGPGFSVESLSASISPGAAALEVPVKFLATSTGMSQGQLNVLYSGSGGGGVLTVPLKANVPAALTLSPGALDFGAIPVGGDVTLPVQVINGGADAVHILGATAVDSLGVFSVSSAPNMPASLAASESTGLSVRCAPGLSGKHTGQLVVSTDAPGAGVLTMPLTCVAGAYVEVSPQSLDFGAVPGNQTRTLHVHVSNVGVGPVELGTPVVVPSESGFEPVGITDSVLSAGESADVFVEFLPSLSGDYAATLRVERAGGGAPLALIPLSGSSGAKLALLTGQDGVDFGVQGVGTSSQRTVVLANVGSTAAQLTDVLLSVPAGPFEIPNPPELPFELDAGDSVPLTLVFSPVSVGVYGTTLQVKSPNGGELDVPVSGLSGGLLTVSPGELSFGEVTEGTTETLGVLVANQSPSESIVVKYFQGGDSDVFQVQGIDSNGATLLPGQILEGVQVSFTPDDAGDFSSAVTFFTDKGVEGGSVDVIATGKSGARAMLLYPQPAFHGFESVPLGQVQQRPIRVGAVGSASVNVVGYALSGDTEVFGIYGLSDLPTKISPASVATFHVTCSPTEKGVYQGQVHLATDDQANPELVVDVACSTPQAVQASPLVLGFGAIGSGQAPTQDLVITNAGNSVLVINTVGISNDAESEPFSLLTAFSEDTGLVPGDTLQLTVQFSPTAPGAFSEVLTLTTTDPVRPALEIPLTGAAGPSLELSRAVVNFCANGGNVPVSISNAGSGVLAIQDVSFSAVPDPEVSFTWEDGSTSNTFALSAGDTRELVVSFNGIIAGDDQVSGAELVITSDDPSSPTTTLRIIAGNGVAFEDGFTGISDVGPPGLDAAFSQAVGLGVGHAELCTGGYVASGTVPSRLYYVYPGVNGGASLLPDWGSDPGVTDLSAAIEATGVNPAVALDFGGILSSTKDERLAVGSSSVGTYLLLSGDGQVSAGGVIRLSELLDAPAVGGAFQARSNGFVVAERVGRQLVGLDETGALDPNFGTGGRIDLGALFDAQETVGESLVVLPGVSGSIAVTDGSVGRIYVVRPNGEPDDVFGQDGVIDLATSFAPAPLGIGAGMVTYDTGFAVMDQAAGRLLFVLADGSPNPSVGVNGVVQVTGPGGAFSASEVLGMGLIRTSVVASASNAGNFVLMDGDAADLLFVDEDGSGFTRGVSELAISPCPVVIADAVTGTAKQSVPIELENTGNGFLTVSAIEWSSEDATCIGESGSGFECGTGTLINSGEPASMSLTWTPAGPGCYFEKVTITHDGVNGPSLECPLVLQTRPKFEVTPGAPSFAYGYPPQAIGTAFKKEVIIRNIGCGDLAVDEIAITGSSAFVLDVGFPEGQAPVLGPGDIHKFFVTCSPTEDGLHTGNVQFLVTPSEPIPALSLSCATGPLLQAAPSSLIWQSQPIGTGQIKDLTITSSGGAPATIDLGGLVLNNLPEEDPGAFTLVSVPSESKMSVGSSQVVKVKFAPSMALNGHCATLVVPSDSFEPVEVPLCGTSAPDVLFEPNPVVIEGVPIDPRSPVGVELSMTNIGAGTLILDPDLSALEGTPFSFSPEQQFVLGMGESMTATVSCAPETGGVHEATIPFEALGAVTAVDDVVTLTLTCKAGECVAVAPELLAFGTVDWESEVPLQTAVIQNVGQATAMVTAEMSADSEPGFNLAGETTWELAKEETADVVLRFTPPQAAGSYEGTLVLNIDGAVGDDNCPAVLNVVVRANVIPPSRGGDDISVAETTSGDPGAEVSEDVGTADGGSVVEFDPTAPGPGTGDDGCGCDLSAGSKQSLPLGSLWIIFLALAWMVRLRELSSPRP